LAATDLNRAQFAFKSAMQYDSADPFPHFGLGLVKIRAGDVAACRREIEIAAGLDPQNSLIRSYLGKAYFEEKRGELDAAQFDLAKALDPNDPTPWLYDAIRLQTENRPVEALQAIQKSIELNDNRAVYRSRLDLDEDAAVRSASQSRIYHDLGFEQLALSQAWTSLAADPGSYSAHRLLADVYSELPRHEIARASELLQSQLRQPINSAPLQPSLAESNLFILEGTAPAAISFNEFSSVFLSNGIHLQADGTVGTNNTLGEEVVLTGVFDNLSLSVGQFHYETDGFRSNNDQNQDIYDAFAQLQVAPDTSMQVELRSRDFDRGDLPLRFEPDNFSANLRQDDQIDSARLGLHHSFAPNSDLVGNLQYVEADADAVLIGANALHVDFAGYLAEVQHQYEGSWLKLTTGAGFSDASRTEAVPAVFSDKENIEQLNVYAYPQISPFDDLTLTIGASLDRLESADEDRTQINPKIGLVWYPWPSTRVRAAAFRTLTRTLVANQTIEPTEVAGFNQFYDDTEGTDAWRYGIGIDQALSDADEPPLYIGGEFSRRDLRVSGETVTPPPMIVRRDFVELFGRAYVYWAPLPWLALHGEYQFELFDRDLDLTGPEDFVSITTHRLVFGGAVFNDSGLSLGLSAAYIDQHGDFTDSTGVLFSDADNFFVVDAELRYRLPDRYGFVSLIGRNILDEKFNFQDTDPASPQIVPESQFLARVNLFF
jgi:tetratricopeptide (TPR) repeat protein